MRTAILLSGPPGCGKTTAIQKILANLSCSTGGFYTKEIRTQGKRVGFKLLTLDGRQGVLAHVNLESQARVGRYRVNIAILDTLAVDSILQSVQKRDLVVVDEIGPMEILSPRFCQVVTDLMDHEHPVLGTIAQHQLPFLKAIRTHPNVILVKMQHANRDIVAHQVLQHLQQLGIE